MAAPGHRASAVPVAAKGAPPPDAVVPSAGGVPEPAWPAPQPLAGLRLADGVFLVLPRQPAVDDLPVLAEAAAPLLAALTTLGLVPDPTSGALR
jgi:hypothetical protein